MADPNTRDAKLIQYLNEAYGKEKELETALQAHIAMTTRTAYKKRLQDHLKETKQHARDLDAIGRPAPPVIPRQPLEGLQRRRQFSPAWFSWRNFVFRLSGHSSIIREPDRVNFRAQK